MSLLQDILNSIIEEKTKTKETKPLSPKEKLLDFEKMVREMAKANGVQPRNFLIKIAEQNPKIAQNRIIQKLIGEQDVPTQKGRDAKPEVLTKRAMNVVKKQIKKDANKERRRMDKDAVEEDGKDDFSKSVNPMGSDSVAMAKIKKSPGFYDMLVTFYTSAVLHDRDDEEVLPIMSSMLNMNVEEIKAVLRQYGNFTFGGSSPEDKFKANMGATGFLGKGKTRTLNSVYEDGVEQSQKIKGSLGVQQIVNLFPGVDDKTQFMQAVMKLKLGQPVTALPQIRSLAQAFKQMIGMDPQETQKTMTMLKRIKTQEDVSDETIDSFHTELDRLVHKYFGHSSDEKKEKVKESVAITEEEFDEAAGEKDACYHKVKSRYKVWPSAYASGALVKCRKVGASNWGNSK